ncbi:MAG: hypothetical protein IJI20_05675 [Firmicutes bacterium]|nr:hypothetical protein [Bacillota bacterium]
MRRYSQEGIKKALAIVAIIILVILVGHMVETTSFNSKVHEAKGPDDSKASYMDFADRQDSTSSWLKRDFDLKGKTVDLQAKTVDGTVFNRSPEEISTWKMTLRIKGDCFINNAWCGVVEIHQFVGTDKEAVQKLDLRNYQLENVDLEYLYDGDLLIPLQKGDYLVYYPSEKDDEVPVAADSELTIGMIFYYLDAVDLSDYEISYSYHKGMNEGLAFYILIALTIIWLGLLTMMLVARATYRRAINEMELRTSGLSYMSDIYDIIYIIDIETDELTPVTADEESEKHRPEHMGARDQLLNLFAMDAAGPYVEMMQEFADIRTLSERLEKQSIACEYLSKTHGWTMIRFLAMDREPGQPLKRVLFTIQNIDEEKQFTEEREQQILRTGIESKSKSFFFDIMSDRVKTGVGSMVDEATEISGEGGDEKLLARADKIRDTGSTLLTLTERLVDASDICAGTLKLNPVQYSFRQMITGVAGEAREEAEEKGIAFAADISPKIPDRLIGDAPRIREIILFLISKSIRHVKEGGITLSVFGKETEGKEHLLISIKDTGDGFREEDLKRLTAHWAEPEHSWNFTKEEPGLGLIIAHEMLRLMDSGLGIISEYGNGSEFYFELDQEIKDPAPIGPMEL